jgi:hypothetical protein
MVPGWAIPLGVHHEPKENYAVISSNGKVVRNRNWVNLQYPNWSADGKWIYFESTGDKGAELFRVEIASRRAASLVNLRDIPRVNLAYGSFWSGLTPNGSPLIMRDASSREVYSLQLQLP